MRRRAGRPPNDRAAEVEAPILPLRWSQVPGRSSGIPSIRGRRDRMFDKERILYQLERTRVLSLQMIERCRTTGGSTCPRASRMSPGTSVTWRSRNTSSASCSSGARGGGRRAHLAGVRGAVRVRLGARRRCVPLSHSLRTARDPRRRARPAAAGDPGDAGGGVGGALSLPRGRVRSPPDLRTEGRGGSSGSPSTSTCTSGPSGSSGGSWGRSRSVLRGVPRGTPLRLRRGPGPARGASVGIVAVDEMARTGTVTA